MHIRRRYDFRSIEIGRWVTDTERDRAAVRFHDALITLMNTPHVPEEVISLQSSLGLQSGSGGHLGVCAHYIPATRQLALANNAGAGSLAHEWFHAFDHYIAGKVFVQPSRQAFASSLWLNSQAYKSHPLTARLFRCFEAILLSKDGTQPSELFRALEKVDKEQQGRHRAWPWEVCASAADALREDSAPWNSSSVSGTRCFPEARLGQSRGREDRDTQRGSSGH